MKLANISVTTKILSIVGVLSTLTVGLAVLGIMALGTMNDSGNELEVAGNETTLGTQLVAETLAMNRDEFKIALNPTPEVVVEVKKDVHEKQAAFTAALAELRKTASGEQPKQLDVIATAYQEYTKQLEETLAIAERVSANFVDQAARDELVNSVESSQKVAIELAHDIEAYVKSTTDQATAISAEATATFESNSTLMIIASIVAVVLGAGLGYYISRFGVVRPIQAIVACLKSLVDGDLSIDVFGVNRKDEVGIIAGTTQVFKENLIKARQLEAEQKQEQEARLKRAEYVAQLVAEFDKTVSSIVEGVSAGSTELRTNAESLTAIAEETNSQSLAVSAAAEQASTNVATVASSAEELSASIHEINQQINGSLRMAQEATEEAKKTNTTVDSLRVAADKISQVTNLIQEIAEQTNLLALNATIEAARAGEAGKGFAVVASEVKGLATQTAKATEEIAAQVAEMQTATVNSVAAIEAIGKKIVEMNETATAISGAAEEQSVATQEISRNVQQASAGTQDVSSNIAGVSQASSDTGRMAGEVLSASTELSKQAELLRKEVDGFISKVKAA